MKHRYITLLTILLAFSLLLCGCGKDTDIAGQITPADTNQEVQLPDAAVAQTPTEEKTVSLGRMEGGVYTNAYTGFGCTLDSSWQFYTAEELQDLPSNTAELMEGTALGDAAAQLSQITDMMAENMDDLTSMNILYTKLSLQERLAYAVMDDEAIIDSVLSQKDLLAESYAQAGIAVSDMEKVVVSFLGETRYAVHTSAQIQGVDYYVLQLFDYNLGEYAVTTTLASYVEDNTESLLPLFYKVA